MNQLFDRIYSPSTLEPSLRSFTFGYLRQLDAVAFRFLADLAVQSPNLVRADIKGYVFFDVDGKIQRMCTCSPRYLVGVPIIGIVDVLIIDGFLAMSIDQRGQEDLTKTVIDRNDRLPTLISSQSSAAYWMEVIPYQGGADSLVSRLNNGRRLQISDYDMRRHLAKADRDRPDHDSEVTPTRIQPGSASVGMSAPTMYAETGHTTSWEDPGHKPAPGRDEN